MAMGKSGLGKGLEALFPSNVDVDSLGGAQATNEKIVEMKINEIEPDINQPRKMFDEENAKNKAPHTGCVIF